MRQALAGPRSRVASARTATVIVWVPALPPIEATIGIRTASATIFSIEPSKRRITLEAMSAVTHVDEQPGEAAARGVEHRVGDLLAGLDAAERLDVLVGLLLDDVDDVVDHQRPTRRSPSSTTAAETRL